MQENEEALGLHCENVRAPGILGTLISQLICERILANFVVFLKFAGIHFECYCNANEKS